MQLLESLPTRVTCLAFSPDGWTLYSGSNYSPTIRVWNLLDSKLLGGYQPEADRCGVWNLIVTHDGKQLIASYPSRSAGLVVWNTAVHESVEHRMQMQNLLLSPDGTLLASTRQHTDEQNPSRYGPFEFLRTESWQPLGPPPIPAWDTSHPEVDFPLELQLCRAPQRLAGFTANEWVLVETNTHFIRYHLHNGERPTRVAIVQPKTNLFRGSFDAGSGVYSRDCSHVAKLRSNLLYQTLAVHVWDTATGEEVNCRESVAELRIGSITKMAFHPNGQQLALGGKTGVCLWNFTTDELFGPFDWGVGSVTALAFAPDGLRLAIGGRSSIAICDLE